MRLIQLPLLLTLVGLCPVAAAQTAWPGARSVAMSGARVALGADNEAITQNPGAVAASSVYAVELGYADDLRDSDRQLSASVLDSQSGELAAGFAYNNFKLRPPWVEAGEERIRGHRFDLSFAGAMGSRASFGLTGRYLILQRQGLSGENTDKSNTFNLDAGLVVQLTDQLTLGLTGQNLAMSKRIEQRFAVAGGLGFRMAGAEAEFDLRYDKRTEKLRYALGAAYVVQRMVALRAGFAHDAATGAWTGSAGLGFISEKVSFDVGGQLCLNPKGSARDKNQQLIVASLRGIFF